MKVKNTSISFGEKKMNDKKKNTKTVQQIASFRCILPPNNAFKNKRKDADRKFCRRKVEY